MTAYRIVEQVGDTIKTLFHGNRGYGNRSSRVLARGVWLLADKKIVHDGTSGTPYESGWHVLLDRSHCDKFLAKHFRKRLDRLKVIEVEVKDLKPKSHSRAPIFLARWMRIPQ